MITNDHTHAVTTTVSSLDAVAAGLREVVEQLHDHAREAAAIKSDDDGPLYRGAAEQISHSVTVLPRSDAHPAGGFLLTAVATVTVYPHL